MASGLVRCALSGVIDDQRLQISTERIVKLQVFGKIILEKITQGDSAVARFDAFSSKLTSLKSTFDCASSCLSLLPKYVACGQLSTSRELTYYQKSGMSSS